MDYYDNQDGFSIITTTTIGTLLFGGVIVFLLWVLVQPKKEEKPPEKKPDPPKLNKPKAPGVPGGIAPKVIAELNLIKGLINGYEDPADLVNQISVRVIEIVEGHDKSLVKLDGQIKQYECEWEREVGKFVK